MFNGNYVLISQNNFKVILNLLMEFIMSYLTKPKYSINNQQKSELNSKKYHSKRSKVENTNNLFGTNYLYENKLLNDRVLVLNQSYEPITLCSPLKAISLLYLSKAELIVAKNDKYLRSINLSFEYPSVIKLNEYKRIRFREIVLNKKNVMRRDLYSCQYCGSKLNQLTIDHIIPKSRGGEHTWENLTTACVRCNNFKGNRTPSEAKMTLMTKPIRPNYFTFLFNSFKNNNEEWKQFLYL